MHQTPTSASPSERWVLVGIVALALVVRVWGINFGLPVIYHPDEGALVMPALNILQTGDYRPVRLDYGSAYIYSLTALYVPYFLYGAWRGAFTSVADLPVYTDYYQIGQYPVPGIFLLARLWTALLGGLTVLSVYALGRRLAGRRVGLVAAALLAVTPIHVLNAHFATTDVPATCVMTLALTRVLDVFDRGDWRDYLWAGFLTGLSASTKFPSGIMVGALLVAHVLRARQSGELFNRHGALGLAAMAGGFLLGTPYALDLPYFLNWMAVNVGFYGKALSGVAEGPTPFFYARELFLSPTGLLAIAGFLGLGLYVRQFWRRGAVFLAFPLLHLVLISVQTARYPRFIIPLIPVLAVGAAVALETLAGRWARRPAAAKIREEFVLIGLVALVGVYPLAATLKTDGLLATRDVRAQLLDWYNANVPRGAKAAVEPNVLPFGSVDQSHPLYITWDLVKESPDWYLAEHFDFIIITEPRLRDPNVTVQVLAAYRELMNRFTLVETFTGPMLGTADIHIWVYRVTP